jgi:hypothetical protein
MEQSLRSLAFLFLLTPPVVNHTSISSFGGDGGLAIAAKLNRPTTIAVDQTDNSIYFMDARNYRVRRIDTTNGMIDTVVGTGELKRLGEDLSTGFGTRVGLCAIQESYLSLIADHLFVRSFCHLENQFLDYLISDFSLGHGHFIG